MPDQSAAFCGTVSFRSIEVIEALDCCGFQSQTFRGETQLSMSNLCCVEKGGGAGRANKSTGHHHLVVTRYAKILHNRNKYAEHGDSEQEGGCHLFWQIVEKVQLLGSNLCRFNHKHRWTTWTYRAKKEIQGKLPTFNPFMKAVNVWLLNPKLLTHAQICEAVWGGPWIILFGSTSGVGVVRGRGIQPGLVRLSYQLHLCQLHLFYGRFHWLPFTKPMVSL